MPDTPIWLDTLYFEGDRLLEVTKHFRGKEGPKMTALAQEL